MEFILSAFKICESKGMASVQFTIDNENGRMNYDELLLRESEEDVMLLLSIEKFIRAKAVKKDGELNDKIRIVQ